MCQKGKVHLPSVRGSEEGYEPIYPREPRPKSRPRRHPACDCGFKFAEHTEKCNARTVEAKRFVMDLVEAVSNDFWARVMRPIGGGRHLLARFEAVV